MRRPARTATPLRPGCGERGVCMDKKEILMKAVGYYVPAAGAAPELVDLEAPKPVPGPKDLLVAVRAVSVNPIDTKLIRRFVPANGEARILGFDAAGVVETVGSDVSMFKPGDEVYYAGHFDRQGSNAEYQIVDERLVGGKPKTLSFAEAAALPLTSLTAHELLFARMRAPAKAHSQGERLLVVNGGGGVGSILIQLARALTGLEIIATASRPETEAWCRELGATRVVNHRRPLDEALIETGVERVEFIAGLTATQRHFPALAKVIAPQGTLGIIDDVDSLDFAELKRKCVRVCWEFMFARGLFHTPDMTRQHEILDEVARLVDTGDVKSTMNRNLGRINAENLRAAHALIGEGAAIGKVVLEGF